MSHDFAESRAGHPKLRSAMIPITSSRPVELHARFACGMNRDYKADTTCDVDAKRRIARRNTTLERRAIIRIRR